MTPKSMFTRPAVVIQLSVALMAGTRLTGCSDDENGEILE